MYASDVRFKCATHSATDQRFGSRRVDHRLSGVAFTSCLRRARAASKSPMTSASCDCICQLRGWNRLRLAALGAVENHPGGEIVGDMLEAMVHPRWDEQKITRRKERSSIAACELTVSADDHIHLVPPVCRLVVKAARGIQLDLQAPMMKRHCEPFAFRAG